MALRLTSNSLKFLLLLAGVYMVVLTWLQPFSFFAIADAPDSYGVNLMKVVLGADCILVSALMMAAILATIFVP